LKQRNLRRKKPLLHPLSLLLLGSVCLCAVERPAQAQTTSFSFDVNSLRNSPTEATTAVYQGTNDTVTFSVIGTNQLEMSYVYGSTGAAAGGSPQAFAFNADGLTSLTVDTSNLLTTVAPDHIKQDQNFASFGAFDWELQYNGGLAPGSFTTVFNYTAGLLTPDQLIAEIAGDTSVGGTPVGAAIHLHGGPNGLSYKLGSDSSGVRTPNVPGTPEGSSGLLLMVGMVPMAGIMVWKSRRLAS
jgi:hypothetical protein